MYSRLKSKEQCKILNSYHLRNLFQLQRIQNWVSKTRTENGAKPRKPEFFFPVPVPASNSQKNRTHDDDDDDNDNDNDNDVVVDSDVVVD